VPLYDYQCAYCDRIHERMEAWNDRADKLCPYCNHWQARRIVSAGQVYLANQDAAWLKTVPEVIGTETREGREAIRNPTRANIKAWEKTKGLRHLEAGEPMRPTPTDMESPRVTAKLAALAQKRRAITVKGA
jgi:putative FmdB family regulatory protein